jgi:hypothetical protein
MGFPRLPALLCSLVLTACALCAPAARAVTVQVSVTSTVTGIDNHSLLGFNYEPFSNLAIGDTVTGSWSYDTATPFGVLPLSGFHTGYLMQGMSFSTGGGIGAFANFSNAGLATFELPGTGRLFPEQSYAVSLQFQPNYFDAIPPSALDMSAFLFGSIFGTYTRFPGNFISYSANVTNVASVVPLPSAAWLFVSALLGLFGMHRSRRRSGCEAV